MCGSPLFHRIDMMIRVSLTVGMLLVSSVALRAEQKTEEEPNTNFTDHVLPIFREHCLQCHNANDAEAGLAIDSYGALMEGGGSGDAVTAGDASASRLYLVMTHAEEPTMPPNQEPIAKEQLEIIRKWIDGGLLENSGSKAKKRKGPSLTFTSMEGGKPSEIVMPESVWRVPVVTSKRAAASSAIAASPWAPLVAIAGQKQVALYNTDSGELEGIIPFPEGIPQVLKFSVDGGYLMVAGGTHSSLGTVALYNVKTGERLLRVGDELDTVFGADVNNDLSKIAMGGPQKLVRIFDSGTGDALFELKKHTDWVYCVDFSPDGVLVASGDRSGGLHVWEADTGRLYLDLVGHKDAIRGLSWRADSNVLVSASEDGTVKLWEMNAGNQLKSFNAHGGGATGVVMAKDGRMVTCGKDKTVKLWNADGGAVATMPAFTEAALEATFTHDGGKVIGGDWNGRTVMWNVADPKQAVELFANPPRLEEQSTAIASEITDLEKGLAVAKSNQTNQQTALEKIKSTHDGLVGSLGKAKAELVKVTADKASAEKLLAELKKQKGAEDQRIKSIQATVASLEKQSRDAEAQLKLHQESIRKAVGRRDLAAKQKLEIVGLLAKAKLDHDQLKAAALASLSALAERELDVAAKEQAARNVETQSEASRKTAEEARNRFNEQVTAAAAEIKVVNDQVAVHQAALQKVVMAIAAIPAKIETAKKNVEAKTAELNTANQKLAEAKEEAQKKTLAEQVAKVQGELQKLKVIVVAEEKSLADQNAAKIQQEKLLGESSTKLASVTAKQKDLAAKRDAAQKEMDKFLAARGAANKQRIALSKQLAQITGEVSTATKMKEDAVKKMAELVKQQMRLGQQEAELATSVEREEGMRKAAEKKMTEVSQSMAAIKPKLDSSQEQLKASVAKATKLATKLKSQPSLVAQLNEAMKKHTASVPMMEKQIADLQKKVAESTAALAQAKAATDTANQKLVDKKATLSKIQSELVAFKSQSQKLTAEMEAAAAAAAEKRKAVEPVAVAATKHAEAVQSRELQMKQVAEAMAKMQAQLDELDKLQAAEKQSLESAKGKLLELETAADKAEADAEAKKEKAEFFKSVYGA